MQMFGDLVGKRRTTRNGHTENTQYSLLHNRFSRGFVWFGFLSFLFLFSFAYLGLISLASAHMTTL